MEKYINIKVHEGQGSPIISNLNKPITIYNQTVRNERQIGSLKIAREKKQITVTHHVMIQMHSEICFVR